jgi:hypothetical protein
MTNHEVIYGFRIVLRVHGETSLSFYKETLIA